MCVHPCVCVCYSCECTRPLLLLVVPQDSNVKLIRELKAEIQKLKSIILSDAVRLYRHTYAWYVQTQLWHDPKETHLSSFEI